MPMHITFIVLFAHIPKKIYAFSLQCVNYILNYNNAIKSYTPTPFSIIEGHKRKPKAKIDTGGDWRNAQEEMMRSSSDLLNSIDLPRKERVK